MHTINVRVLGPSVIFINNHNIGKLMCYNGTSLIA